MITIKGTSVLLICLLVFTVIYGLSAALVWYLEEAKDLAEYVKMQVDDKIPHRLNPMILDDKIPHGLISPLT